MKNPDAVGEAGNLLCVLPDTQIHANGELIPIQNVKKRTLVLSHEGRFYPVKVLHERCYDGKVILINNRLGKILLTPEHLVLAKKIPNETKYLRTENKKKIPSGWYHATELEKGDIVIFSIPKEEKDIKEIEIKVGKYEYDFRSKPPPSTISLDEKFLKLVGYYLAEGHASTKVTSSFVQFSLNMKDLKIAREISKTVGEIFGLRARIYLTGRTVNVYIFSSLLSRFFKETFGDCAEIKHLPHFMMLLPKEKQKHIIYGLWKGDGYINLKRKNPRAGFSTISRQLAQQLKVLLLRQGIIPSLYVEEEKTVKNVHHKQTYRIHIGQKDSLLKLCDILGMKWDTKKFSQRKSWIENGHLYTPITRIEIKRYKGLVYNLEVEGARSFVTNNITLHNCGDVMRIYLKIKKSKGEEIISDIRGEVFGCIVAIANTSLLTTLVKGKTLKEALKIKKEELIGRLGGMEKVPSFKVHCSILALDALHEAIYNYYKKRKLPIPSKLERAHRRIRKILRTIEERYKEFVELERGLLDEK